MTDMNSTDVVGVRILAKTWTGQFKEEEIPLTGGGVIVGRYGSGSTVSHPILRFDEDSRVSRQHVKLWREGSEWFIEDLGSKHGTRVDGQEIKGLGVVKYIPGSLVRTGNTVWMAVPGEWLLIRGRAVVVFGPYMSAVSYAVYHCSVPLVGPLIAKNLGDNRSSSLSLMVELDGFGEACRMEVPSLEPRQKLFLDPVPLHLNVDALRCIVEPVSATLHARLEGFGRSWKQGVHVLNMWDWPYELSAHRMLAAFVSPRNPAVEKIVMEASEILKKKERIDSFESLLASSRDDAEMLCVRTLYECLRDRRGIRYVKPRLDALPSSRVKYQRIRRPDQILSEKDDGTATCLDLALLFAGCMENVKLMPLIILLNIDDLDPHSFAGCWLSPTPGPEVVFGNVEFLRREVEEGHMLMLETTGVLDGYVDHKLDFTESITVAENRLKKAHWACAIDIGASRPRKKREVATQQGKIIPMDCPREPVVEMAYKQARRLAVVKRHRTVELTHLLYGLLIAEGEVVTRLLLDAGLNGQELVRRMATLTQSRIAGKEPIPSENFHACQHLAFRLAWQTGSRLVREQDLLCALLLKAHESEAFMKNCGKLGLNLQELIGLLEKAYPCPPIINGMLPSSGLLE